MIVSQQLTSDFDVYDDGFDYELSNEENTEHGSLYSEYPLDEEDEEDKEINYWNTSVTRYYNSSWTRIL